MTVSTLSLTSTAKRGTTRVMRLRIAVAAAIVAAAGFAAGAAINAAHEPAATPKPATHIAYYPDGVPRIDFTTVNGVEVDPMHPCAIAGVCPPAG